MRIFAIDDEPGMLELMCREIKKAAPNADVQGFSYPGALLKAARAASPDAAFIDIRMPDMDGVELASQLKTIVPRINIIFATGYSDFKAEALDLRASGYILKPVSADDIRRELGQLRYAPLQETKKRIRFQYFGNFEVYADGRPLCFRRSKTKEVLAYLVDSRSLCSNAEIAVALWDNDVSASYLRNLRKDLTDTLSDVGCEDILIRQWDKMGIDQQKVSCDFYDWLGADPAARGSYWGDYMRQYNWAEHTRRRLEQSLHS